MITFYNNKDALRSSPCYISDFSSGSTTTNQNDENNPTVKPKREWGYGVVLPYPARTLMKAIYEILTQMNTVDYPKNPLLIFHI